MTREWKPGDVALIEAGCHANRRVAVRTGTPSNMGWAYSDTFDGRSTQTWTADSHGTVSVVRQLVVIDPEDCEQCQRLAFLYDSTAAGHSAGEDMQAALRRLSAPDEPTGLGAVVEDVNGDTWTRADRGSLPWFLTLNRGNGGATVWGDWPEVRAVKILSEGVTA